MKLSILIGVLFLINIYYSQNLVPNPSFETFSSCPNNQGQLSFATGWTDPNTATSDYFNGCNSGFLGVPSNAIGNQQARTGSAYVGFMASRHTGNPSVASNYREYAQIQLTSPLVAGKMYEVEFYWSLADGSTHSVQELGAYLSNSINNAGTSAALTVTPQVSVSGTPLTETTSWVRINQTIVASGGEQYITIGNFNSPTTTTSATTGVSPHFLLGSMAFYFVDDVSVKEVSCFEIEKILVDACDSHSQATPDEGQNEMVTFKVGPQNLNVSNLSVTWASNPYGGIVQNTQTAQLVSTINSSINACGYLLEPVGGVLPAGSEVLLITSYLFNPSLHSFANLSDTLIVIFQNSTTGSGHFGNYNSSGGSRTLSMSFSSPSGCSDVVSYERDQLVEQDRVTQGAEDGAFVSFTPDGTATYDNLGCQVPAGILSIDIDSDISTVCGGEIINLTAVVEGSSQPVIWLCSEGVFSSQGALTTSMTVNNNVTTSFYIYGGIETICNDTIYDSILISINTVPNVTIIESNDTLCTGQHVVLTASGADTYIWNGGVSTANPYTISSGGVYSVSGTSSCGTNTATITIHEMRSPFPIVLPSEMYSCDSNELHSVDLSGNVCESCTYTWSDGTIGEIYSGNVPNYSVVVENYCGSYTVNYHYDVLNITADIIVQDSIGDTPFTVPFQGVHNSGGTMFNWNFDNGNTAVLNDSPIEVFTSPGEYTVSFIVDDMGCKDTAYQTIIVNGALPTEAIIPNVFTPNKDGQNDLFSIKTINGKDLTGAIFNRWGTKIKELNGLNATWDGGDYSAGTYYYVIEVQFLDDSKKEYKGHIQLIK